MRHMRMPVVAATALVGSLWAAKPAGAADCASLTSLAVPSTTITSTALVPAGAGFPEYCNVNGYVDTEIVFALRLPTRWNGKFYFTSSGGLDGLVAAPGPGLRLGYAEIATNTGHASTNGTLYDGSWAFHNTERQINWAYRSTHVVAIAGKTITSAYYGSAPRYSYFAGCSGGGRHAAMSAQRYPADFDGVVDGLISDPRRCRFDPKAIACPAGVDRSDCLTQGEVASLGKFYGGPRDSHGEQLFPGWEPGLENLGWPRALVNTVTGGPGELLVLIPDNFLKYFVFGPGFDPLSFNFDRDPSKLEPASELLDVKPDFSSFAEVGGKIIMYHGWADPRLVPVLSIQFHGAVERNLREEDDGNIDDFYRLFMVPGMLHCAGGTGPTSFDAFGALVKWVEQGIAPDRIIGSHFTKGVVDRTRPLCPYPQEAVYAGHGSVDDAANFVCQVRHVRDTVNEDYYSKRRENDGEAHEDND